MEGKYNQCFTDSMDALLSLVSDGDPIPANLSSQHDGPQRRKLLPPCLWLQSRGGRSPPHPDILSQAAPADEAVIRKTPVLPV